MICVTIIGFRLTMPSGMGNDPAQIEQETNITQTIERNRETLLLLQPENWKVLTNSKRREVLYTICMIEKSYLGIKDDVILVIGEMSKGVGGFFDCSDLSVNISWKKLHDAELLDYKNIEGAETEEQLEEYRNQHLEVKAREYARERKEFYHRLLQEGPDTLG